MKKINIFLIILGVCLVFFLSEVLYAYDNSYALSEYSFKIAKVLSSVGYVDQSVFVLGKTDQIIARRNTSTSSDFAIDAGKIVSLPSNKIFKNSVANYLNSLPSNSFGQKGKYDLGRVFYDLAIMSYINGYKNLTRGMLQMAINYNPDLSFWSVELANYYLFEDNLKMAKNVLDNCITLQAPRQHCQNFLTNNVDTDQPENVGFLGQTVSDYFTAGGR